MTINKIGVIGGGAWGTALASVARSAGRDVVLWAREEDVVNTINADHVNAVYLPDVTLDGGIHATTDLSQAVDVDAVLLVVPAQHLRSVTEQAKDFWKPEVPAVICAKGVEQKTEMLMSEILSETLPGVPQAVLSGPTFAIEVALGMPTAVTLACSEPSLDATLAAALGTSRFRTYRSDDVIGAQIGGAVKNVLAIGCGIVEGKRLGDNARAALITRGIAEIGRIALAKGAKAETVMGLSCLGDLTLTCNALQSRNFSLGVALGEGRSLDDILGERKAVTEGVYTASSVTDLSRKLEVEVPICVAVDGILNHYANIDSIIEGLLARPAGEEFPTRFGG